MEFDKTEYWILMVFFFIIFMILIALTITNHYYPKLRGDKIKHTTYGKNCFNYKSNNKNKNKSFISMLLTFERSKYFSIFTSILYVYLYVVYIYETTETSENKLNDKFNITRKQGSTISLVIFCLFMYIPLASLRFSEKM